MMMNRISLKRVISQLLAWAALLALTGAIAVAQAPDPDAGPVPAQSGQRSDGQIEMDVVHALDASKTLKNDLITAATIQSEVTLSGTVSTQASKDLAASIAARVDGVTKVNNNLQVGNPQDAAQAPASTDPGAQQMADSQPDDSMAPPPPPSANARPEYTRPGDEQQGNQRQQPGNGQPGNVQPGYGQPGYGPPQDQSQGPPPEQGQPPYPGQNPQWGTANPRIYRNQRQQAYAAPNGPVTIPPGTVLQLRTNEGLTTRRAKDGEPVQFTLIRDVVSAGVLAIPRGATVEGVVTESKKAGDLGGSPELALRLTSLDLGGQSYPLDSDQFRVRGPNKAGQTVGSAVGGGIIGTIIGCAVGRGVGCAVGAGAGIAAGTAASAASPGPGVWIPAEALVTFHLNSPLTVNPVDSQEAARLAQGLYPGGPSLYRRGYYPYGSPYYGSPYVAYGYGGYPYGYPPVYYRPYYFTGGYYYWR